MAKLVLAGPANDPFLPRCELLADHLKSVLPNFEVNKIFVQPKDWEEWLQNTCDRFGWQKKRENKGPIFWRELVTRGGKATLIGDSNDFQEFCRTYYGVKGEQITNFLLQVAVENQNWTNERDDEEKGWVSQQIPSVVAVWNSATDLAQLVLGKIAQGGILPYDDLEFRLTAAPWMLLPASRPSNNDALDPHWLQVGATSSVESVMGDSSSFVEQLNNLEMIQKDLEDMACDNLRRVLNYGSNSIISAIDAKLLLIIIDDSCNSEHATESFRHLGRDLENALDEARKNKSTSKNENSATYQKPEPGLRVLFVSSSVECMSRTLFKVASKFVEGILSTKNPELDQITLPDYDAVVDHQFCIEPSKVLCLTTPIENAAKSLVSKLLQVKTANINNLIIWSRPDTEQQNAAFPWSFYVDVNEASVSEHLGAIEGPSPYCRLVADLIAHEKKFLQGINDSVSARYIVSTGRHLAVTSATCDFLRGWFGGAEKHPNLETEMFHRQLIYSAGLCKFLLPYHVTNPKPPPAPAPTQEQNSSDSQEQPETAVSSAIPSTLPTTHLTTTITAEDTEEIDPKIVQTGFQSLPVKFTGRDDLEGKGYLLVEDMSPPADIFNVPQSKVEPEADPGEQQTTPAEEAQGLSTEDLNTDGTSVVVDEGGVAAAMASHLENQADGDATGEGEGPPTGDLAATGETENVLTTDAGQEGEKHDENGQQS